MGGKHPAGRSALLPRELYEYTFQFQKVLDLTSAAVLDQLNLGPTELIAEGWELPQSIGAAAHAVSFQAIRAPSATGVGDILCVMTENTGAGTLLPRLIQVWQEPPE